MGTIDGLLYSTNSNQIPKTQRRLQFDSFSCLYTLDWLSPNLWIWCNPILPCINSFQGNTLVLEVDFLFVIKQYSDQHLEPVVLSFFSTIKQWIDPGNNYFWIFLAMVVLVVWNKTCSSCYRTVHWNHGWRSSHESSSSLSCGPNLLF